MSNEEEMKRQLVDDVAGLSERVAELEAMESERNEKELQAAESLGEKRRFITRILIGLPIFIGLFIFITNRSYFLQFFNPETLACGLPLLGVAIALTAGAYLALRRRFSVIESGKPSSDLLLVVLVTAFLILPAILVLVLGPATLILLDSPLIP